MIADPTEATTREQINKRADETIGVLKLQNTAITNDIRKAQAELAALTQEREARYQGLQQARALFEQHEAQHNDVSQYLKLVQGTPREAQAIKSIADAKKPLAEERNTLHKLEREAVELDKADKAKEQELIAKVQELMTEQEATQLEVQQIEKAKERAFAEEGFEKYGKLLPVCKEKNTLVESLEAQLIAAKVDAFECHTEAIESLKDLPMWQSSIAQLRAPDDATIRVLRANIELLTVLEADASQVRSPSLPSLRRVMSIDSLYSKLLLGEEIDEVVQAAYAASMASYQRDLVVSRLHSKRYVFKRRRQELEQLLAEYITLKQGSVQ